MPWSALPRFSPTRIGALLFCVYQALLLLIMHSIKKISWKNYVPPSTLF